MKKYAIFTWAIALGLAQTPCLFSQESKEVAAVESSVEADNAKISEAFGHLIGKNIDNIGFTFDFDAMVKGLQDYRAGKEPPLNEMDCIAAITAAQEKSFMEMAAKNLAEANAFMEKNAKEENIAVLEEGKLHYRIDSAGSGVAIEEHFSPVIRYTGKFLDGSLLGSSMQDEKIVLDETIPGIKQGLIGMREGEKRTLFIHPDLAYGTADALPPNSLLTFEIELVTANAPKDETDGALSAEEGLSISGDEHLTEMPAVSLEELR